MKSVAPRFPATAAPDAPRHAVVFDPESLVLDPTAGMEHSLRCTLTDLGIRPSRNALPPWSPRMSLPQILSRLLLSDDRRQIATASARYRLHFDSAGRYLCRLRPGGLRLLARIAGDSRFELHYLTHIGHQPAARLLNVYGLQPFPRAVVSPTTPQCPGIRLGLLRHLVESKADPGPPRQWTLLGDHPWELMLARQLEIGTVALGYSRMPAAALKSLGPDAVAESPDDIMPALLRTLERRQEGAASASRRVH